MTLRSSAFLSMTALAVLCSWCLICLRTLYIEYQNQWNTIKNSFEPFTLVLICYVIASHILRLKFSRMLMEKREKYLFMISRLVICIRKIISFILLCFYIKKEQLHVKDHINIALSQTSPKINHLCRMINRQKHRYHEITTNQC